MAETLPWSTWPPAPRTDHPRQRRVWFSTERPRIVVAHPNHHVRWFVSSTLRLDHHQVACARGAPQLTARLASWMLEGNPADLVICGPKLGTLGARELIRGVRGSDWSVPILGVTGPRDLHLAAELGDADAVFNWPFDGDDLRTVALHLATKRKRGAA